MNNYTYKTDLQIVMFALAELLQPGCTEEDIQLAQELLKRGKEQKMHIPYHIRQKMEVR